MKNSAIAAGVALCSSLAAANADLPGRTFDKLEYSAEKQSVAGVQALSGAEIARLAGRQKILCMIGDSVTWAEDGDHFRAELLKLIPDLAFAGTHTAMLGYSHAGEGGDSTVRVLNRVWDVERVPDAPYYHLLIGINDCSAAKSDEQSPAVASGTVERIEEIVELLVTRAGVRKVFVASILPSPFDMETGESTVRERTGSVVNKLLRQRLKERFPENIVVWIEYEKPLRADLDEWKKKENLRGAHPTAQGYKRLAAIAAPVLQAHMRSDDEPVIQARWGVEVVNLWLDKLNGTAPLIPGWYTLSLELDDSGKADITLYSETTDTKQQFKQQYHLQGKPFSRAEVNFMTGYQNFGYTVAPFKLTVHTGKVKNIQIEKMRPLQRASRYGTGEFIDTVSPIAAGEVIVPDSGSKE